MALGEVCGDGIVNLGVEQCDDGNQNNTDFCKNDCKTAVCGDGVVYPFTEACDDGNKIDGDACKNNCAPNWCGDKVVYLGVEQCDDGNINNNDGCSGSCKTEGLPPLPPPPDSPLQVLNKGLADKVTAALNKQLLCKASNGLNCRLTALVEIVNAVKSWLADPNNQ